MSVPRRLMFLLWFATHDLVAQHRARRIALVHMVTVLALVSFIVVVAGLALGYEQLRLDRLRNRPLATCLWLVRSGDAAPLTPDDLSNLEQAVRARLSSPARLRGCYPFRRVSWDWHDLEHPGYRLTFHGRTLAPSDPLLEDFPVTEQPGRSAGVVVTRTMLDRLQGRKRDLPPELVVTINVKPGKIRLRGVLELVDPPLTLPGELHFVLTEAEAQELRSSNRDLQCAEIRTGPVPQSWLDQLLPPEADKWLKGVEWLGAQRQKQHHVWGFKTIGNDVKRLSEWQTLLKRVASTLPKPDAGGLDPFIVPEPLDPLPIEENAGYNRVALYMSEPEDLPVAAEVAQEWQFEFDRDLIRQIKSILQATGRTWTVLALLITIVTLLAAFNLYVVHDLRAQQKVTEIGLLQAMGMSDGLLWQIPVIESLLIWIIGGSAGLLLGWWMGKTVAAWWVVDPSTEESTAFVATTVWLTSVLFGALLVSVGSVLLATRKSRRAAPIDNLS
jgi:hypothetical protein